MGFGTSYFEHDIFSNSFLSVLKQQIKSKEQRREMVKDPHFFRFGKEFEDVLLYDTKTEDIVIKKMVEKVRSHSFYQSIIKHPKVRRQHEFYRKFYGLNFKSKTDLDIPGYLVPDIKSTNAKTLNAFLKSIMFFDYDRQIYVYMVMARCDNGAFIGCSKEKNPKVFVVSVKKGDYIYQSGKRKTEELIAVLKSLI